MKHGGDLHLHVLRRGLSTDFTISNLGDSSHICTHKMSWATGLFGTSLLVKDADGKVVSKPTEEALKDKKFVALYFSAHVSVVVCSMKKHAIKTCCCG